MRKGVTLPDTISLFSFTFNRVAIAKHKECYRCLQFCLQESTDWYYDEFIKLWLCSDCVWAFTRLGILPKEEIYLRSALIEQEASNEIVFPTRICPGPSRKDCT